MTKYDELIKLLKENGKDVSNIIHMRVENHIVPLEDIDFYINRGSRVSVLGDDFGIDYIHFEDRFVYYPKASLLNIGK